MPDALTITQPATARRAAHPKAAIVAEGGLVLELPYAPRNAGLTGWADTFEAVDRPGRGPIVVRNGDSLDSASLEFLLAHRDHRDSIEGYLTRLRTIAESGDRITLLGLSPQERGPWRLNGVTVAGELRQHGTNHITRATVSVDLLAAVDANPRLGPVSGGKKKHKKHSGNHRTRYTRVRQGESIQRVAIRMYGEPRWRPIARANKLRNPRRLKVGMRLRIPPLD